jgi:hypothetical protein
VVSNLRCVAGYYEATDGEKQANKTRALNVVQFIADLAESNRRQLCDTGGAMKGMRYSTFTLNVLAGLTAAGGAAAGRVQHLNLGGPSTSTLERHTRRLRVQFNPLNPAKNVEAYAAFIKDVLDAHAGHDASKRHVLIEYVRCCYYWCSAPACLASSPLPSMPPLPPLLLVCCTCDGGRAAGRCCASLNNDNDTLLQQPTCAGGG